jgi:hypothetical protein
MFDLSKIWLEIMLDSAIQLKFYVAKTLSLHFFEQACGFKRQKSIS